MCQTGETSFVIAMNIILSIFQFQTKANGSFFRYPACFGAEGYPLILKIGKAKNRGKVAWNNVVLASFMHPTILLVAPIKISMY